MDKQYKSAKDAFEMICYIVKSLALFFCFYPLFSLFFEYAPREAMTTMNLSSMIISVLLLVLILAIWLVLQPGKTRKPWQQFAEMALFLSVCTASVMTSGAASSPYKFLFIFIVVTYTFQFSMRIGLVLASISSLILLAADAYSYLVEGGRVALDSDVALSIMFFIVAVIIGRYVELDRQHIADLTRQVNIDGLTGLYNHRYFHELLEKRFREAKEAQLPLSLVMLDLDYFKVYNDIQGHQDGDLVLKQISELLIAKARKDDLVCRYGGEEFVLIMPNTDQDTAIDIAENIRVAIMEMDFTGREFMPSGRLTASVGIALMQADDSSYNDMIRRADQALYRAKYLRKNSVQTYQDIFEGLEADESQKASLLSIRGLIGIINQRDNYTFYHTERVALCCDQIAPLMGLSEEEHKKLVLAAYMHDIGKIEVPKEILIANRRLNDEEWAQIKMHPAHGRNILERIEGMQEIATIVSQHHERYDGKGYPYAMDRANIHPLAFILQLADSYDAMTNNRPYQEKRSVREALDIIRESKGTQFHPETAGRFIVAIEQLEAQKAVNV